jgi:ABC-type multidrug transport system ATPase subunit
MGPSGCGKTTIFSCIVGTADLDKGNIKIFNKNSKDVHKNLIGFMPQETALSERLKIKETIWIYGTIFGLTTTQINEKFRFLSSLLELPDGDKLVKDCSGGEQRRISLAVTLVHEPDLLILDEPTVGLDPIIRENIWNYLFELSRCKRTSILLSTHYVEEAKNVNRIGLMRNGCLVDEDSPHNVMAKCGSRSLEEAFLTMCEENQMRVNCEKTDDVNDTDFDKKDEDRRVKATSELKVMHALLMKLFWEFKRNWP